MRPGTTEKYSIGTLIKLLAAPLYSFAMNRMLNRLLLLLVLCSTAVAQVRVIDEVAIPYAGFLSKVDFDARFPGELLEEATLLKAGWYVVYQHEALNYHFGPITLESVGQDYERQLRGIVSDAVAQRPDLEGYSIDLKQAPFEAAQELADESPELEQPQEKSTEETEPAQPEPVEKPFSLWGWVKGLFGF